MVSVKRLVLGKERVENVQKFNKPLLPVEKKMIRVAKTGLAFTALIAMGFGLGLIGHHFFHQKLLSRVGYATLGAMLIGGIGVGSSSTYYLFLRKEYKNCDHLEKIYS